MPKNEIAFLVYRALKKRKKDTSFDASDNIGALVIVDRLKEGLGLIVDYCSPETAKDYKIVLVSMTSTYDCIAFYQAVALIPSWQSGKRKFHVVAGGFGMQNPTTVRNFVDYAIFGRGEDIINNLVDTLMGGGVYTHESVMNLPEISPVVFCAAKGKYKNSIKLGRGVDWVESVLGCPGKCKFCHYTWAREQVGVEVYFKNDMGKVAKRKSEIMWKDIRNLKEATSIILTAIDGCTEKLRFAYGKRIKNSEISDGINHVAEIAIKGTGLDVYNILNFPGEQERDIKELESEIKKATPQKPIALRLHSTPFRASLLTPMSHCHVDISPRAYNLRNKNICSQENLKAFHSVTNEGPYSQLIVHVIDRAAANSDKLFHTICFSKKIKNSPALKKIELLMKNFDLSPYLREYSLDEKHPAWFLSSYTSQEKISNIKISVNNSIAKFKKGLIDDIPEASYLKDALTMDECAKEVT